MSDAPEKHEKTFDPTPRRLEKAREEGNVFRSREMVSVGMLSIGISAVALGLRPAFEVLEGTAEAVFRSATTTTLTVASVQELFAGLGMRLSVIVLPFAAVLVAAAFGLNVVQSGWNLTLKPLMPKGNRISPVQGLKRIFSKRGFFDTGKALVKVALVGPIAYAAISGRLAEILTLHRLPLDAILATVGGWVLLLLAQMVGALALLAAADFAFEKWRYTDDLKMSAKEVKDEAKETDGDPHVKSRRRQIAREMARRPRLDHAVLKGDVVVTNPTHYAVVLRYDPAEAPAPVVLAKGIRKRALRIKELAAEHGVPTVEDRPLARALYASVEEEQQIPEDLFPAVAAVLAEIYRQREGGG